LSLLAKWLARKTPLRKPNRGEGIISIKPRPKSAHDFLGLLYCFIVLLCICVVFCPYMIYYPTVMVRYSLFVMKVPLNPKQTNQAFRMWIMLLCTKVNSAFHPSGVGKWVPAAARKAKAGMAHSDCRWTCGCAGKTVKSLENTRHTWAFLRWCFTTKRLYIECMHLYLYWRVLVTSAVNSGHQWKGLKIDT